MKDIVLKGFRTVGVQLADVLASSVAHSLRSRREEFSDRCMELAWPSLTLAIVAEPEEFQPDQDKGALGMLVLLELVDRSARGEDPVEGMGDYIWLQKLMMPAFREFQSMEHGLVVRSIGKPPCSAKSKGHSSSNNRKHKRR